MHTYQREPMSVSWIPDDASRREPKPSMSLLIEDFVNREEHLDMFRKIVHRELEQRILIVHGPAGIGKTYLLDECRAMCEANEIKYTSIDFAGIQDRSYMAVVQTVWEQLGPQGFEPLLQA